MISVQVRYYSSTGPGHFVEIDQYLDFPEARPAIGEIMEEIGFSTVEVLAHLDELDPDRFRNPQDNILKSGSGNEIRVIPLRPGQGERAGG